MDGSIGENREAGRDIGAGGWKERDGAFINSWRDRWREGGMQFLLTD